MDRTKGYERWILTPNTTAAPPPKLVGLALAPQCEACPEGFYQDAAGNTLAVTARADVNKNAGTDGDILTSDVANGTVVTLTITPKDNTNALLNDSAVEHTITVTA